MQSESTPGTTRFGTSVQLTARGTAAVNRFWTQGAKRSAVITPADRLDVKKEKGKKNKKIYATSR
jgi:hypothetical protein